jgi:hypothetical protein
LGNGYIETNELPEGLEVIACVEYEGDVGLETLPSADRRLHEQDVADAIEPAYPTGPR